MLSQFTRIVFRVRQALEDLVVCPLQAQILGWAFPEFAWAARMHSKNKSGQPNSCANVSIHNASAVKSSI